MIITQAPLRISFVGGGTDLSDFYRLSPGRVISTAIDKYVYIVVNHTPLVKKVTARYSISETVDHPSKLQHNRIRAALLDLGLHSNIEIGAFSHLPAKTGLGSSSSFSVALLRALYAHCGKKVGQKEIAEAASRLEIDLLKEPIGKQDQYASAIGGFNILQFNSDGTVDVEPLLIDYKKRLDFERHLLVFFTGITRLASSVLTEQKANTAQKFETLKTMADSVFEFKEYLLKGEFQKLGELLHKGWLLKKTLASKISNGVIDDLYQAGLNYGAWGGKILGAGSGGCILFIAPLDKHAIIKKAMKEISGRYQLNDFQEIPVRFVQSGAELILNND